MTPLDAAAAPEGDDAGWLAFYAILLDAELHLWLAAEPSGPNVTPRLFEVDGVSFALAFDTEERLSQAAGGETGYATMSGRSLAVLLAEAGLGLGLNFGAPSETLLPPDHLDWLAEVAASPLSEAEGSPSGIGPPSGLPETLLQVLDVKLAAAEGLARTAYLASVGWKDGRSGHLVAFVDPRPGAEAALGRAASEALAFTGVDATDFEITMLDTANPLVGVLDRVALRFDLPQPERPERKIDPNRPPRLR